MVYSLFTAEPEIKGNLIISYADIVFDYNVLNTLLETAIYDISVVVDLLWKEYYQKRFVDPFKEAESLVCDADGGILNIGQANPAPENVCGQYIGLIKLCHPAEEFSLFARNVNEELLRCQRMR